VACENGSEINAIGEGAHQFRQLVATAVFADEFAFWEKARETYSASRPTIEATGRFTGVSSAYPSFFKQLVFDELEQLEKSYQQYLGNDGL
jgi:phage FluMu gp28-like protein